MNSLLTRVLESEVMDGPDEAMDYDAMDHSGINALFVADFLAAWKGRETKSPPEVLDAGAGTAQIPIRLCQSEPTVRVTAVDMARSMLELAARNVAARGLADRIQLIRADAKSLPYGPGRFAAVISNSIVHHIPEPRQVLAEAVRVSAPGGLIFVRDLLRPTDDAAVRQLVETYAGQENDHQRAMFDASLRAALSLDEIRGLVASLHFDPAQVTATSDRHWTWIARKLP